MQAVFHFEQPIIVKQNVFSKLKNNSKKTLLESTNICIKKNDPIFLNQIENLDEDGWLTDAQLGLDPDKLNQQDYDSDRISQELSRKPCSQRVQPRRALRATSLEFDNSRCVMGLAPKTYKVYHPEGKNSTFYPIFLSSLFIGGFLMDYFFKKCFKKE